MSESKEQPKPAADDKDAKKEQEKKEIHKDADVLKLLEADEDDFEEFEEDGMSIIMQRTGSGPRTT